MTRAVVAGLSTVVLVSIGLAVLWAPPSATRGVEVGDLAPDYGAPLLSGEAVSLSDQRGRVVLVNIWATWCGPCRVEMPPIEQVYERYSNEGCSVLAVSVDAGPDHREKVERFIEEYGLAFPVLLDPDGRVTRVFQTVGVPETFVLDRQGVIVKKVIGATEWDAPAQKALIDRLLAERAQPPSGG